MKIKNIITVLFITIILASCTPTAKVVPIETATPTSNQTNTPSRTLTTTETPTSPNTETPITIESLSGQQLFDMFHKDKVEYGQLSVAQRRELAILNGEYIRSALVSKTITSTGTWDDGSFDIGLTNSLQWARVDSLPSSEFADASDHVAPSVADCFINDQEELVELGPNGEEYVVPRFNVEGSLAGLSVVDVTRMSQSERKAAAIEMVDIIAEAMGGVDPGRMQNFYDYMNSSEMDIWPIFIDPFYARNNLFVHWSASTVSAARVDVLPTNVVSSVILDESGAPLACIRIHQASGVKQNLYDVSAGDTPNTSSTTFLQPENAFGKAGDTVALANFFGEITSNQGSFLLRGGSGAGGVDVMRQLGQAKTIDQIRAVICNIIFNQSPDLFGDFAPR